LAERTQTCLADSAPGGNLPPVGPEHSLLLADVHHELAHLRLGVRRLAGDELGEAVRQYGRMNVR
jgi:hypothetical protein